MNITRNKQHTNMGWVFNVPENLRDFLMLMFLFLFEFEAERLFKPIKFLEKKLETLWEVHPIINLNLFKHSFFKIHPPKKNPPSTTAKQQQKTQQQTHKQTTVYSKCLLRLIILRVSYCSKCLILYSPFCHGAPKPDPIYILFATRVLDLLYNLYL